MNSLTAPNIESIPSLSKTIQVVYYNLGSKKDAGKIQSAFDHSCRVKDGAVDILREMGLAYNSVYEHVALLHDVIDDAKITLDQLRGLNYPEEVVVPVAIVSNQDPKLKYEQYISKVLSSDNVTALVVKLAEVRDNTNLERIAKLDPDSQAYFKKRHAGVEDAIFNILRRKIEIIRKNDPNNQILR